MAVLLKKSEPRHVGSYKERILKHALKRNRNLTQIQERSGLPLGASAPEPLSQCQTSARLDPAALDLSLLLRIGERSRARAFAPSPRTELNFGKVANSKP